MKERRLALVGILGLCCLLIGCNGGTTPPDVDLDQPPLSLVRPFFNAGYELAGYHELDTNSTDASVEVLIVLTLRISAMRAFESSSAVLLFSNRTGMWTRDSDWKLNGVNASTELRDLTGDESPELLVSIENAERQWGDFITPMRYTNHLHVFSYTLDPDPSLVELGVFSSSLQGVTHARPTVGEWADQPAIRTARDLSPTEFPLWQPIQVETFAWDGQEFSIVQVEEQRRISPIISWITRHNAPWAVAFLALGGILSLIAIALARRLRWQERRIILAPVLLLIAGGIGLGLALEWVCAPALILLGLAGVGIGQRMATRMVAKSKRDAKAGNGK